MPAPGPVPGEDDLLERVAGLVRSAGRVVALTGAGISTESGIPDFRGPQGVWTKDPKAERLSTLKAYMEDPELRVFAWRSRMEHPAWTATPNAGHLALAQLERKGKLHTLVTQNIDGLHQKAGTSPDRLVEIHGTLREVMCMSCDERAPMEAALERVRAGEADPACRTCGGILKSATISFGQALNEADMRRAHEAAESCDLFLAIGTSLTVYPVAYLPAVAAGAGATVVVMNAEPTRYDAAADVVVRTPVGRALSEIAARV
ncbi:MAG TPA: Sir2 family NAD-dependent protein deacetylase [Actinomycetota bacterium]|nr:Sir2 family NAD-dependent protein deacetylase [Actinomycetota bacterium]